MEIIDMSHVGKGKITVEYFIGVPPLIETDQTKVNKKVRMLVPVDLESILEICKPE